MQCFFNAQCSLRCYTKSILWSFFKVFEFELIQLNLFEKKKKIMWRVGIAFDIFFCSSIMMCIFQSDVLNCFNFKYSLPNHALIDSNESLKLVSRCYLSSVPSSISPGYTSAAITFQCTWRSIIFLYVSHVGFTL